MFAGLGTMQGRRVAFLGHRKGKTTKENIRRNFGSPHPEGFRKAMRIMQLADRFGLPLVTFLDTAGAFPGIEAEERGQALAIAESIALLSRLRVPVVVAGIGEGGSGGALAIGFGDRVIMLENAYYSVISPEACASILYKDSAHAQDAASCLKMTAHDLVELGIADEIVAEPIGGAHNDPQGVIDTMGARILAAVSEISDIEPGELTERRYMRLRAVGVFG
jgi:acetyl-CoA carboxylase carboxyl transferase alpha subunit